MASVNEVLILGNLGKEPETKYTADGTAISRFSVATSRKYKDSQGQVQEETEWHRIVCFGKIAEIVQRYLKKGSPVFIKGRLRTRKYTDKEGIERFQTEIVCESLQMLGSGAGEKAQQTSTRSSNVQRKPAAQAPAMDDDTPF